MKRISFSVFVFLSCAAISAAAERKTKPQRTAAPIRALLATRCLECHSGVKPKGGLDLSSRQSLQKGGDSGAAVVAGSLEKSPLWKRVAADEMPPKHPLSKNEKAELRRWILGGAKWRGGPIDRFRSSTSARAGYDWWSLQPLADVRPPTVRNAMWARNGIDRFILKRLLAKRLKPSRQADSRTLIRRLYFDLIGLPPTPDEVEAFVSDPSDRRYTAIVNRLLSSKRYGERWGRHWLDVVRFGESNGFERNKPRKNFWHYRDWVIQALNDDMPYDRFVRMQLAGDLLQPGPEGAAAVGFLVAGVHNTVVGGSKRMKLLARQDELEEIVSVVGQTFLGLTINCARCHDHKFDPVRTEEYYRMIAALDGVRHGERNVPRKGIGRQMAAVDRKHREALAGLEKFDSAIHQRVFAKRKRTGTKSPRPQPPKPFAKWEFDGDLKDGIGKLHGKAMNGARLEAGALVLDGKRAFVRTAPLTKDIDEKTLEAWVRLDDLAQRGGAAISIETIGGNVFDAVVFGERNPRHWMAGSNFFRRTKPFHGPAETAAAKQPVHVAIVYRKDGTITGYRNGVPYGKPYKTEFQRFQAGKSHIVFGLRHAPSGGNKMLKGRILRAALYDRALSPEEVAASAGVKSRYVSEKELIAALSAGEHLERDKLKARREKLSNELKRLRAISQPTIYTVAPKTPGVMRVHIRGSVTDYGAEVAPGGVKAVAGVSADFGLEKNAGDAQRRKRLAAWITDSSNALFARVIVNRVWHYHFGTGIVETPNDLGFNGGRPTHPELIDWLARRLRKNHFRLKSLHRLIVHSAAYRQASKPNRLALKVDAQNRLLWRFSPHRVEAEVLRDAMLQTAGLLNLQQGGPGFVDVKITENNGTTYYEPFDPVGPAFHRRTVYRFTPRGGRSAVLDTFDCPDPSAAAPRRSVTTTPLQALSLLNNAFVLRMSAQFANRVRKDAGATVSRQVVHAWRLALGRRPDSDEAALSEKLVRKHGLKTLCRALFNCNEFVVIE